MIFRILSDSILKEVWLSLRLISQLRNSILAPLLVLLFATGTNAQTDSMYYMCFQDSTRFGTSGGSDCWGWTSPEGVDYAIMGVYNGVVFVNTQTMVAEGFVAGPTGGICGTVAWRDIKTLGHYCYVVSECTGTNQGLQVIDMHYLPDSVHLTGTFPVNGSNAWTSHNLSVDSIGEFLYLEGNTTPSTSIYMFNLSNPTSPAYWGSFGISSGIHDIYAYDDTVYVAEGSSGKFAVWDLSNKLDPKLIVRPTIPDAGYVHNIWPTADRQHCATTEETAGKTVKIWDISLLKNIQLVGEYLAPNGLAHNVHFKDDTLFISHYQSGVAVVDITNPANPTEISRFDTFVLGEGLAFAGAWGCYPFSPNNLIYGSNMDGSLWIMKAQIIGLKDTLYPGPPIDMGSDNVKIDIFGVNSLALDRVVIPFSYAGPATMIFDSASTGGTRGDALGDSHLLLSDEPNQRAVWEMASTGTSLDPGSGVILSLWFSINSSGPGGSNPISFLTDWTPYEIIFGGVCREFEPVHQNFVDICCLENRGNIDGDPNDLCNILDLSFLINRLFRGGPYPVCPSEADLNGDGISGSVFDLNYLVSKIFRGGPEPVSCDSILARK